MESLNFKTVKTLAEGFTTKDVKNVVNSWENGTTNNDKVCFGLFSSLVRLGDSEKIALASVLEQKRIYEAVEEGYFVQFYNYLLN
jgi:hypothetical protein